MTVLEVIQRSTAFLEQKEVDSPRLQIELMLAHVMAVPRLKLYLNFERVLTEAEVTQVRELVKRRGTREPLQHILGNASFCGLEIKCSRGALVPRPETELLAERGWKYLAELQDRVGCPQPAVARCGEDTAPYQLSALDFGTGTGCIAIALAAKAPQAAIHAIDISADAIALARENAAKSDVAERVSFHLSDGFAALPNGLQFDLIVSNPPYIASEEISTLQQEVRDFDPRAALDGGIDGLDFYRRIAKEAPTFLKPGGKLMAEFGDGQAEEVKKIFSDENWIVEEIVADYSLRARILIARPAN